MTILAQKSHMEMNVFEVLGLQIKCLLKLSLVELGKKKKKKNCLYFVFLNGVSSQNWKHIHMCVRQKEEICSCYKVSQTRRAVVFRQTKSLWAFDLLLTFLTENINADNLSPTTCPCGNEWAAISHSLLDFSGSPQPVKYT